VSDFWPTSEEDSNRNPLDKTGGPDLATSNFGSLWETRVVEEVPIGRLQLYRNVSGVLPVVSDVIFDDMSNSAAAQARSRLRMVRAVGSITHAGGDQMRVRPGCAPRSRTGGDGVRRGRCRSARP
jgi:hypothetical protein